MIVGEYVTIDPALDVYGAPLRPYPQSIKVVFMTTIDIIIAPSEILP